MPDLPRLIARPCDLALLAPGAGGRVGFEARSVSVADHSSLQPVDSHGRRRAEADHRPGREASGRSRTRARSRRCARACAVADQALAELIEAGGIRPGRTEREVGLDLDQRMRQLGAEDPSFETIVAAGPNSAIPHHRPTAAMLAAGDFVKLDFGATVDGYHSDMTRTFVLGDRPTGSGRSTSWSQQAQAAGRAACLVGATGGAIDAAARDLITDAGYGDAVLARARARRRAADPRSAGSGARIGQYHGPGHVRHRRARGLPAGARRSTHRGQRRDPRGRLPGPHADLQGAPRACLNHRAAPQHRPPSGRN